MPVKKDKEFANESDDWAILPFDEAEDDARWTRLIEETEALIKEAKEMEAIHGVLSMKNKFSDLKLKEKQAEDNPF